mmetsp:Transcript_66229/g.126232  ORF Transcript_66229/g.126232 Transcript_66229/m.126232 type:complete len:149 (+) Transcript_66229:743-1189(+)
MGGGFDNARDLDDSRLSDRACTVATGRCGGAGVARKFTCLGACCCVESRLTVCTCCVSSGSQLTVCSDCFDACAMGSQLNSLDCGCCCTPEATSGLVDDIAAAEGVLAREGGGPTTVGRWDVTHMAWEAVCGAFRRGGTTLCIVPVCA